MSRAMIAPAFLRRKTIIVGIATLLGVLLTMVFQPVFTTSGAPGEAPESQIMEQATGVVFQAHPTFVKFPPKRVKKHGVWFVGAGLKADQEVKIQMVWGLEGMITDITSVLEHTDEERGGVFANVHGAFAVGFDRGFRSVDQDFLFYKSYEPVSMRLVDAVSGETLAVAPMVICGPAEEEPWCGVSSDIVPLQ